MVRGIIIGPCLSFSNSKLAVESLLGARVLHKLRTGQSQHALGEARVIYGFRVSGLRP